METNRLAQIVAPAVEPVTLADLKSWLRVDITDDDSLITDLGIAARELVEDITGRRLINQTWAMFADEFPTSRPSVRSQVLNAMNLIQLPFVDRDIEIPLGPCTGITALKTTDANGVTTTFDPANYVVDTKSEPARLVLKDTSDWPDPTVGLQEAISIEVDFTLGYGADGSAVPSRLKTAIKMLTAHWYNNREPVSDLKLSPVPDSVDALLDSFRMFQFM